MNGFVIIVRKLAKLIFQEQKILEALFIKELSPSLNTEGTSVHLLLYNA